MILYATFCRFAGDSASISSTSIAIRSTLQPTRLLIAVVILLSGLAGAAGVLT